MKAWAIKHPLTGVIFVSIRKTKKQCMIYLTGVGKPGLTWKHYMQHLGYRCVRVNVEEVK